MMSLFGLMMAWAWGQWLQITATVVVGLRQDKTIGKGTIMEEDVMTSMGTSVYVCSEDETRHVGYAGEVEFWGGPTASDITHVILRDIDFKADQIRDAQVTTLKADVEFYKERWARALDRAESDKFPADHPPEPTPTTYSDIAMVAGEMAIDPGHLKDALEHFGVDVDEPEGLTKLRYAVVDSDGDLGVFASPSDCEDLLRGLYERGVRVSD